jgi:transposase-like protein
MESLSFDKPREYLELARRLLNGVNDGKLSVTKCTCPLQDLFSAEWPANLVEHDFECSACGRTFQLFADTYLGHAGWGVTGPQTREPALAPSATV